MFEFDDRFDRRIPIFLSKKGGPRIAPTSPDVIEVECIYEQISTGAKVQRWVPLTEVIDLPLGYVVHSGLTSSKCEVANLDGVQNIRFRPKTW